MTREGRSGWLPKCVGDRKPREAILNNHLFREIGSKIVEEIRCEVIE